MSVDPQSDSPDSSNEKETVDPNWVAPKQPMSLNITESDAIDDEFDEDDFDEEFDDDFEEEVEGEYELADDQYGEEFNEEFGHLTKDEDDIEMDAE